MPSEQLVSYGGSSFLASSAELSASIGRSTSFEAAGSIKPALVCSDAILASNPGQNCWAPGTVAANFTSLEPSPRQTPQRRRRAKGY